MRRSAAFFFLLVPLFVGCASGTGACDPIAPAARALRVTPGIATTRLVADWRGDSDQLPDLALPVSMATAPDGRVAIPDFQLQEVVVIDPSGGSEVVMGSGRGPGEVDVPLAATWTENGDLLVFDTGNSRVTRISADGTVADQPIAPAFSSSIVASGEVLWTAIDASGRVYSLQREPRTEGGATEVIVRAAPGSSSIDTIYSMTPATLPAPYDRWPVPGTRRLVPSISRSGAMVIGGLHDDHRVTIDHPIEPIELCVPTRAPEDDASRSPEPVDEGLSAAVAAAGAVASPAPYGRIIIGIDDRIWAHRALPSVHDWRDGVYGAAGGMYDVFENDGSYLFSIEAPPGARILAASSDHAWGLEFDEMDVPVPVRYRLEP